MRWADDNEWIGRSAMRLTIDNGEGEGGGGGSAPPADPAPAPTATNGDTGSFDLSMLEGRRPAELLSNPELRSAPALQDYKSLEGLAESHVNLQKMLGQKDRLITLPGTDAGPEEWGEVFAKLGRPDKPTGYQFQEPEDLPEGTPEVSGDLVDGFRAKAHEAGLTTQQANELYSWFRQTEAGAVAQTAEQKAETLRNAENTLRAEWGAAYDDKLAAAREVAASYGDDFVSMLEETGVGNDPRMAKVLADLWDSRQEDQPRGAGVPSGGAMTPDQAEAQIQALLGDEAFTKAFYDQHHPNHDASVEKMKRLYEMKFPEPRRA